MLNASSCSYKILTYAHYFLECTCLEDNTDKLETLVNDIDTSSISRKKKGILAEPILYTKEILSQSASKLSKDQLETLTRTERVIKKAKTFYEELKSSLSNAKRKKRQAVNEDQSQDETSDTNLEFMMPYTVTELADHLFAAKEFLAQWAW